jgi:hypothetical protein
MFAAIDPKNRSLTRAGFDRIENSCFVFSRFLPEETSGARAANPPLQSQDFDRHNENASGNPKSN